MHDSIRLTIRNRADQVALVGHCIRTLTASALGERAGFEVELATCEAINNVIEHGYGSGGNDNILIDWVRTTDGLQIRIHDWGKPLSREALVAALPDIVDGDVHRLPEGGFGIGLLHALMDRVEYHSDDEGRNTLSLYRAPNRRDDDFAH
jgi:serine/threonine-protein kinase RsbW